MGHDRIPPVSTGWPDLDRRQPSPQERASNAQARNLQGRSRKRSARERGASSANLEEAGPRKLRGGLTDELV